MTPLLLLLLIPSNPDACQFVPAHETKTLTADDDGDTVTSAGGAYHETGFCKKFVADFEVASNANPASKFGLQFHLSGGPTAGTWQKYPSLCLKLAVEMTTYLRAVGASAFVLESTTKYKGTWSPSQGKCSLAKVSGEQPSTGTPSKDGTITWRVAVKALVDSQPVQVSASIAF